MKATIITIGDEILIGQVIDTNSAWIGKHLAELGHTIQEIVSIKDERDSIIETLDRAVQKSDWIFLTGGLGPTKDDITKKCIAEYLNVDLEFNEEVYQRIVSMFNRFNRKVSESHRIQSYMPSGGKILYNRMGTAPGLLMSKGQTKILSMPGVPYEMKAIMEDHIFPVLKNGYSQDLKVYKRTIMTAGAGETSIEDRLHTILERFPEYIKVAYLPSLGSVRIRLTSFGGSQSELDGYVSVITNILGDIVYGYDDISLSESLLNLCTSKELKIGLAESCTGGILAHKITSIAGASKYFEGGLVSYTNSLKHKLLHVQLDTLHQYGAVSEQTVIEMAKGALALLNVDVAVSISGIAGPGGGTETKPVGTTWICIANKQHHDAFKILGMKDRINNIEYSANIALNNLRKFIMRYYS
jgi:nicotinamide-nucleotide amidase